jgi:hypothetical protein
MFDMPATGDKQALIHFPLRVTLNERGVTRFVNQEQVLSRFRLSNGREEYGIALNRFAPKTVQKLILLGYVERIEAPVPDPYAMRSGILDVTKLIGYAMLYRQFDTEVFDTVSRSEFVRDWNRRNMKRPIDFKTKVNADYLNEVLRDNQEALDAVKGALLDPVCRELRFSTTMTGEEVRIQQLAAERFVDNLSPLARFLLTVYRSSAQFKTLIGPTRDLLRSYMRKTNVPEYLGLLLLELLNYMQQRETANDSSQAGPDAADSVYLLWRMKKRSDANDRGKLHVVLSNSRAPFDEMKHSVNDRSTLSVERKSLQDFYQDDSRSSDGTELGMYYLSFVNDACRKVGVLFDSFVHQDSATDRTLLNTVLTF